MEGSSLEILRKLAYALRRFYAENMNKFISIFSLLFFISSTAFSQDNLFSNLDYPELQVAPRASERLAQLAEMEDRNGPLLEWTLWTSGLMTLSAGLKHRGVYKDINPSEIQKRDSDYASTAGILVGASWITLGTYMGFKRWSAARLIEVKRISAKDKRGELARERMAEEALEFAANTTSTLENISVWTNLAASIYITSYASEENKVYGLLAATTSFLPWLFPNVYTQGYKKHLEYKKKIYAPLAGFTFNEKLDPLMTWTWNF